jgi:multidrug efflux pump
MLGVTFFGIFLTPVFYYLIQGIGTETSRKPSSAPPAPPPAPPQHDGDGQPHRDQSARAHK